MILLNKYSPTKIKLTKIQKIYNNLKNTMNLLHKFDKFQVNNLINYNKKSSYSTCTGSICSIVIILTFIGIFSNAFYKTITKKQVSWTMSSVEETNEPLQLHNTTSGNKNKRPNYFAIRIKNFNLNAHKRIFDIIARKIVKINDKVIINETVNIPLGPCNISQWNINQNIQNTYKRFNFSQFLCPIQNPQFQLQGQYTSQIFKYVDIRVLKCNSSLNLQRPCQNDSVVSNYLQTHGSFYLNIFYINTLINPDSENKISYFLQDRNYISFTPKFGGLLNIYFSKYTIITDDDILFAKFPGLSHKKKNGILTNSFSQIVPSEMKGDVYAKIILRRSSTQVVCKLSYSTLNDTLSYIGGLFSALLTFFAFFLNPYNQISYKIEAADQLCETTKQESSKSKNFNICVFIKFQYFRLIKFLTCGSKLKDWELMQEYKKYINNFEQYLDIITIAKKINYLEKVVVGIMSSGLQIKLPKYQKFTFDTSKDISRRFQQNSFTPRATIQPVDQMKKIKGKNKQENNSQQTERIGNNQFYKNEASSSFDLGKSHQYKMQVEQIENQTNQIF